MKNTSKLGKIAAIAAGAVLVYSILGFLLLPVVLKNIVVQELTRFTRRPVAIRGIDFNPYTMSFTVHDFQVEEPDGGIIFSVASVHATFVPVSSFLGHVWVFKGAVVGEPFANIIRNASGKLNFSDLLLLDWPKNLRLRCDLVRVRDGKVAFHDAAVPGGFATSISGLTATVKNFWTLAGHDNSISVTAVSESGESFSWTGLFRVHPVSSRGEIAAENVVIRKYLPYFKDRFDFTIADGNLTARSSYKVDLARDNFTLRLVDGALAARSLEVDDRGSTAAFFSFERLALSGMQVDLIRQAIDVASIVVTGGSAVVKRLADRTFNVQRLMKPPGTPSLPAKGSPPAWSFSVGEVRLKDFTAEVSDVFGRETVKWKELVLAKPTFRLNPLAASVAAISLRDGEIAFIDPSLVPPVRMAVSLLDVRIGAFSSEKPAMARVAINAKIDESAPLQIYGETNPIGQLGETSVRGLLQNVNMVPLSPYAAKYLGYQLTAGSFGLETTGVIQNRKLTLENAMTIDGLTLGPRSESAEATKLPVRLAIALLKDANGRITLHVPLTVALDMPVIEIQKALIEGFIHPFARAATFPFAALGAQLGYGGEELGFQAFLPGSANLLPQETGKLDTILQGLKRWPEILLDIEGSVDPKNDTGDLRLLAALRAETVKAFLLRQGTLEPDRIFLIESSPGSVLTKGSRALLSLTDQHLHPR